MPCLSGENEGWEVGGPGRAGRNFTFSLGYHFLSPNISSARPLAPKFLSVELCPDLTFEQHGAAPRYKETPSSHLETQRSLQRFRYRKELPFLQVGRMRGGGTPSASSWTAGRCDEHEFQGGEYLPGIALHYFKPFLNVCISVRNSS